MKKSRATLIAVLALGLSVWANTAPAQVAQCNVSTAAPTYSDGQTRALSCDTSGRLRTTGGGGGGTPGAPVNSLQYNSAGSFAGAASWTTDGTTVTGAPASDASALIITGHAGAGSAGNYNKAVTITAGTGLYDNGLTIYKPDNANVYSALDIIQLRHSGGYMQGWMRDDGFGTVEMSAMVTDNGTVASGNLLCTGTNTGTGRDKRFSYPSADSPNFACWGDTPVTMVIRSSNTTGAINTKFLDDAGNNTLNVMNGPSIQFGRDGLFTGAIGPANTTLTVTVAPAGGNIEVGDRIVGPGVTPGTFVTALGTGTGGAGTYTVNQSQTVASTALLSYMEAEIGLGALKNQIQIGGDDSILPQAYFILAPSVLAGTSNKAGAKITYAGSASTGSALGGPIAYAVALAGSSGTAQNPLTEVLLITPLGASAALLPGSDGVIGNGATGNRWANTFTAGVTYSDGNFLAGAHSGTPGAGFHVMSATEAALLLENTGGGGKYYHYVFTDGQEYIGNKISADWFAYNTKVYKGRSDGVMGFTASTDPGAAPVVGIARVSDGVLEVNNGTKGTLAGIAASAYTVGVTAGASCTLTIVSHLTVVNGIVTLCN